MSAATTISPTASVEEGATLGAGTTVWALSQVRSGASIGTDCVIGRNVFIDADVVVGDRCKIQNNALLFSPARLGHGVFIGPAVVLTNDRYPRAICPDGSLKDSTDWRAEGVSIQEGASVGAGATVLAGVSIGAWSLIASGSVVIRDVPHHALMAGSPARQIGWVGRAGFPLERTDDGRWRCPSTGILHVEESTDGLQEQEQE